MVANTTTLYLLPDTNLFIQCRHLKALDWAIWKGYDAIDILVTRPVQREIDHQKSSGRGRVQKRAREASSLFREVILSPEKALVIRDTKPRVTLRLRLDCDPDSDLTAQLDYQERDDQLVGTLSAFLKKNPDLTAELLTDDTGPMAKADMVKVPWKWIPEHWLLEPEGTNEEKKIRALESEIASLKNAGPSFNVFAIDADGNQVDSYQFDVVRYESLQDAEIKTLIAEIRSAFPIETDFGSSEHSERDAFALGGFPILGLKEVYEPADPEDIETYRDKLYPEWVESCERRLRSLHDFLNDAVAQPEFAFVATNEGAQPASDALVTVAALGTLMVVPRSHDDQDGDGDGDIGSAGHGGGQVATLPIPPQPPKGDWKQSFGFERQMRDVMRGLAGVGDLHGSLRSHPFDESLPTLKSIAASSRDPNAFYYKPSRPLIADVSFTLECEQWRHGGDSESFLGKIYFSGNEPTIKGALELTIHAENLPDPVRKRVSVCIRVTAENLLERAKRLIADLPRT